VKFPIYWKLLFSFALIIILMLAASAFILTELYDVTGTTKSLTVDARTVDFITQLGAVLDDEQGFAEKYLSSGDTTYRALFTESSRQFSRALDSLAETLSTPLSLRVIRRIEQRHAWYFASVSSLPVTRADVTLFPRNDVIDAGADTLVLIRGSLDILKSRKENAMAASIAEAESTTRESSSFALALAAGTLLVAVILALLIARTFSRPIDALVRGTEKVAHGAFEPIRVSSHDELARLAQAFNRMTASLNAMNALRVEMMQQISHELRVPLQTMYSAHYLLSSAAHDQLGPEQHRLLASIRQSIDKIADFSNKFLDLSKLEAGMMEFTMAPVDLAAIVQSAVDQACISAKEKRVSVTLTTAPAPPALADAEKCAQIFNNLLSNAVKYTEAGGSVRVAVGPTQSGVQVTVADSGIGVAPEELPHLFTKFYRARNAVTGKSKGTGLGLALVKALVEGHGGHISVTSVLGRGSTFAVELPSTGETPRHAP